MKRKGEKFLFNQNIFDEPDIEEEEDVELPPPPTFSEEELETVRKTTYDKAYEAGKQDGIKAERTSRDEIVAQTLQKISHDTGLLFSAEDERERIFEAEALRMTLAIFEKLFPLYKHEHGFDELKTAVENVLKKQEGQSQIVIEVHPDNVEGIKNHIHSLGQYGHDPHRYEIKGTENLDESAFRLRWKDGGAIRDVKTITDEIEAIIKDTLAGTLTNSHDSKSGEYTISPDQEQNTNTEPEQIPSDPDINQTDQNDTKMESPDE